MKNKHGKSIIKPVALKKTDEDILPLWPRNKPLPKFKSYKEEVQFWHSYQFEDPPETE